MQESTERGNAAETEHLRRQKERNAGIRKQKRQKAEQAEQESRTQKEERFMHVMLEYNDRKTEGCVLARMEPERTDRGCIGWKNTSMI